MKKVVLGFSGGVDSAVCSVLLKQAGYEVHGVYLDNSDQAALDFACSSAEFSGIPLEVIDVKAELEEKVCRTFTAAYLNGETPNPCIICNPSLKFKNILSAAEKLGADCIATGHYARTADLPSGGKALYKGNPENDQSYMLCRLLPEQLNRLILPLGSYPKSEVRRMAEAFGLPASHKPDSMEICFIPDKDYIGWISRRAELPPPGKIIFHGKEVGDHSGIYRYTVGQRYPGLIDGRKIYISKIDPLSNNIELSLWEELFKTELATHDFNWLSDKPDEPLSGLTVRVRHTKWENPPCTAAPLDNGSVKIICDDPVRAPAPGQSAVLYCGDRVLGGGFICNS